MNRESRLAIFAGVSLLSSGCGFDPQAREQALIATLDSERRAHLEVDAERLASTIADSMVVVADGAVFIQHRNDVLAQFTSYFENARYTRWDDVVEPLIHIGTDGASARVHRHVGVERTEPDVGDRVREVRFESAWTATYGWTDDGWKMTSVASTFLPETSVTAQVEAGARRRVGLDREVPGPPGTVLRAVAEVEAPGDDFSVAVHSALDGGGRIDFDGGFSIAAFRGGGWIRTDGDVTDTLPNSMLTFLRGHEVHMTLLRPGSRLIGLSYAGRTRFSGEAAIRLVGQDAMGGETALYYRQADTLPLGFEVMDHTRPNAPPVRVTTSGWERGDGTAGAGAPLLADEAEFRQGNEIFRYRYVDLEWLDADEVISDPAAFDVVAFLAARRAAG